jgi:hypothetical protein
MCTVSLNYLVGGGQQRFRDGEANVLAVLRLMTNSNLVGWMTGKAAGFATNA